MTTLNAYEDALVAQIEAALPSWKVEAYPDRPETYAMKGKQAVLVAYGGSRYGDLEDNEAIVQTRRLEFDVFILIRAMRRTSNNAVDVVRSALTGLRLPGCTKLFPLRDAFRDYHEGEWQYALRFACDTVAMETVPDEIAALLTQLDVVEE